jgi:hypothetical protein
MCRLIHFERMVAEAIRAVSLPFDKERGPDQLKGLALEMAQQAVHQHICVETGVDVPFSPTACALVQRALDEAYLDFSFHSLPNRQVEEFA